MSVVPLFLSNQQFQFYIQTYAKQAAENLPETWSLMTSFTTSFLAILVSEIGDKTFFLAMIMALRYSEIIVFIGAFGALFLMTVLSTIFGKLATAWISPIFTNVIVTILFIYFGVKMLMDAKQHVEQEQNEQKKQIENELKQIQQNFIQRHSSGSQVLIQKSTNPETKQSKPKVVLPNSHILTQAFMMTFLAEWGDRSQIATIALAASFNAYMVAFGACLGHFICTAAACKIGVWISGKVSQKQVLIVGGIVFIISGLCTAVMVFEEMGHHSQ